MRRALALGALAATLALFFLSQSSSATPISGTPVQVLELGPSTQSVPFGTTTNFTWAVFNGGPQAYSMSVQANASSPDFRLEVFPSSLTIARDEIRIVQVNVSTPSNGDTRTATIQVLFATTTPVISSLQVNTTLIARSTPVTIDVLTAFVAIGAIIAIGFTASWIFERTHVPDLLILIFLGVLLGPVALHYFGVVFVPPALLVAATPYFTAVALMMILFDGGLNLPLLQVFRKIGVIGIHTGVAFVGTVFAVAFVTVWVLGWSLLVGLLLGAVLGGTSSAVVIGIARALRVGEDTKVVLILESVLTDVLCVVSVIAIIELLRGGPGASVGIVFVELAQTFFVALALGLVFGVGWVLLLRRAAKMPFAYMLTIAVLFILYGITEVSGGSGAMASFIFGLVLGNHTEFTRRLKMKSEVIADERIKQFHSELSFVIRAFFFVFLGLVFTFQFGGGWAVSSTLPILSAYSGTFSLFFFGVLMIFLAIIVVRLITARITGAILGRPREERRVLWSLMGRGLAAAVLASLPFSIPAFTSAETARDLYYETVMAPYEAQFLNITFYIILLTVLATTIGAATYVRAPARAPAPASVHDLGFMSKLDLDELKGLEEWLGRQRAEGGSSSRVRQDPQGDPPKTPDAGQDERSP